jgi:hypothetical protein
MVADPIVAPLVMAVAAVAGLATGSRWALVLPLISAAGATAATGPAVEWVVLAAVSCVAVACGLSLRGAVDQALD